MSLVQPTPKLSTAELVSRYLIEHLQTIDEAPSPAMVVTTPSLMSAIAFLVGPCIKIKI